MVEFLKKVLSTSFFDSGIKIQPFNLAHITYLTLILGFIIGAYLIFKGKDTSAKATLLNILVFAFAFSYFSDFFTHVFVYPEMGGLNYDKLPFHVCTVLCPLGLYAQFGKYGQKIKTPVVFLAIASTLMYLGFPASVGEGEPWCYQAVQTMFYHGVLLSWGILNVLFGFVKAEINKSWTSAVLLCCITVWAKLGNLAYAEKGVNWFFLEEDAFYIGLVGNGILPKWSLMIINPAVFFLAVLAIYGVCILVTHLNAKNKPTSPASDTKEEEKILENA